MSSSHPAPKRRRLQHSCDLCKRKKVRCDSSEMPGNRCSNCIAAKAQCTHFSSSRNYKNSREHVAAILSQKQAYVPSSDPAVLYSILVDVAKYARNLEELLAASDLSSSFSQQPQLDPSATTEDQIPAEYTPDTDTDDGLFVDQSITDPLRRLTLNLPVSGSDENSRFFGKSSSMNFVKLAMNHVDYPDAGSTFNTQRSDFWTPPSPQASAVFLTETPPTAQSFPEDDLLEMLVEIYFLRINPLCWLLHAPSFRRSLAAGEHRSDPQFGAIVLMVCALAARVSDDPRVFASPDSPPYTAGWKWFQQVRPFQPQSRWLFRLQLIGLSLLFLTSAPAGPECWMLTGIGIRIAQQMGAHRRSRYTAGSKIENELLRRAFWFLVAMDIVIASVMGRPRATTSEDYDVDMPTACDDEYREEPHCFQQPANKPALAAYATPYLQLIEIFGRVQKAIYPVKRAKECDPAIVADLDSALNKWMDSIPSHLIWDPTRKGIFLDQSTLLYATYYYVQMLIHRPFIPAPGKTSHSPFPALAICANSARACGHVMEVQSRHGTGALVQSFMITILFDSAVILLIKVWGARRTKFAPSDILRAQADIHQCLDFLHLYEKRWPIAGRKRDVLMEMLNRATAGRNPQLLPEPWLKRPFPEEDDEHDPVDPTAVQQLQQLELSLQETGHLFSLPLSTHELGLLPVYPSFDFKYDYEQHGKGTALGFEQLMDHGLGGAQDGETAAYGWQDWSFPEYPTY